MAKTKEQTEKIFTGIVAKGMGYAIGKNVIKAGEKCAEYFFEETSQLREELEAAKQEIAGLRSSLSASERFRIEDGMSSVNEQNELRKEIERLKGLLYIAWAENYDPHNAKYLPVTRDRNWEKFKSEHNL